jgi:hypothetical protein
MGNYLNHLKLVNFIGFGWTSCRKKYETVSNKVKLVPEYTIVGVKVSGE